MSTVPSEYKDAILLAIAPNKRCFGVKIFDESYHSDINGNILDDLGDFVDRCTRTAIQLKQSIEDGTLWCDIEQHPRIIQNPNTEYIDIEHIVKLRTQKIEQMLMIENENKFIDLGRTLVQSIRIGMLNIETCKLCLGEMRFLSRTTLTPLMLKKNPQIVQWVSKLCRYSEFNLHENETLSPISRQIQKLAKLTLTTFKKVMDFNGSDHEFSVFVFNSAKLFYELTRDMSEEERRQLTIDPEIEFFKQSIV